MKGRCEQVSRVGQIEVQDAPDPANVGLEINDTQTGITCPAMHDIAAACAAGIYSASINLSNSNGDITYYQLVIDEVSCEDGTVMNNIFTGPQVSVNGVTGLTAIALNGLEINGQTGFFADPLWIGRCLKVTATVGNDCGFSTDFSFMKFDGAYFNDPETEQRSNLLKTDRSEAGQEVLKVYPNPFDKHLKVLIKINVPGPIGVSLLSAQEQVLAKQMINPNQGTSTGLTF